ncbi:phage portal protein [Enterococcus faecalis]|uniref:phage portal protein n=1 Tax=Enterococcus faecalis TaxID=1351 RepID=UPI0001E1A361|nr:phage portal protein [Enterococcus faecalis]MDN6232784.1 phage portal protein [Staphylococcus simulans]MDN6545210.1 phage portal protein [Enterococcaceae bacterium]EFM73212.1 putative phage portal protein, SPP1 family [Enterococcus faecalis TX0860]EIW2082522.1 phage portal protein [Enterococcus faecalis]EKD5197219.1 phage portal protein [Enterococcus faecalis]
MFQSDLTLSRYKRLRTKYSTQINEELFDPNDFITEMKPFFNDRERKYKAYTSEENEIDSRPKPNTKIIKVNNKLHAGLYNTIVDQAADHFTGIPVKWDYDITEQRKSLIQKTKDLFLGNVSAKIKTPKEFDRLAELVKEMRFAMLDSDTARYQGACGVAFRLLEPVETAGEWQLWACNVEPWRAEKYENADIFIREKYDTHQKKFFEEMKVVTKKKILTYNRYVETNLMNAAETFKLTAETDNPLETFYLSEFKNNTNRYCDFEVAEELSDAFDRSLSDQQNEVEQFKLAYMMISGSRLGEEEAQRMMEQLGIINLPDPQAKVGYVTKDINKDFNEYHLNQLKKLYYTVTKSIDFNDEVFKSNSSGEARKWQIIALEAKTNTKEQYFKEGLKEVAETMAAFIKFNDKLEVDVSKIVFTFSRSLPTDIGYLAEALPKLAPYVSKRTIINQIPFVKDPDYEADMMNLEQGQNYPSGEYGKLGGADNDEEENNG